MKIINCEQCFTSLPVSEGSHCNFMCSECGWTPDCDDGELIDVKERPIKTTCEKEELYKK